jgi:hypothetical protein
VRELHVQRVDNSLMVVSAFLGLQSLTLVDQRIDRSVLAALMQLQPDLHSLTLHGCDVEYANLALLLQRRDGAPPGLRLSALRCTGMSTQKLARLQALLDVQWP